MMPGVVCDFFGWLEREVVGVASVLMHGEAMSDVMVVELILDTGGGELSGGCKKKRRGGNE